MDYVSSCEEVAAVTDGTGAETRAAVRELLERRHAGERVFIEQLFRAHTAYLIALNEAVWECPFTVLYSQLNEQTQESHLIFQIGFLYTVINIILLLWTQVNIICESLERLRGGCAGGGCSGGKTKKDKKRAQVRKLMDRDPSNF